MRVVHLLTSLNPGGVSTFTRHLLPELARHDVENEIILTLDRGAVADILAAEGFPIHTCLQHGRQEVAWSYRVGKALRRSAILTFPARLARLLRRLKPDIVHSQSHANYWAIQLMAAHAAGAPLLMTLPSPSSQYPSTWQARRLFRPSLRPGDQIVGVSPGVYEAYDEFLSTLLPDHVCLPSRGIPNGIPDPGGRNPAKGLEIRQSLGIPPDALVVGSVSRLVPEKRFCDLFRAAEQLTEAIPSLHVLLVGDGGERHNLEQLAQNLGLGDRIHLAGFQTNPSEWMDAVDITVLPSLSEGLPVALIEAMASNVPFIGSDISAINHIITHEQTGLLVPAKDPAALAQAVKRLADDTDFRMRLAQAARREFLQRYTIEPVAGQYLALYESMRRAHTTGKKAGAL